MLSINTTQVEILQAENGFSVAINRPMQNFNPLGFDPVQVAREMRKGLKENDGEDWKNLLTDEQPLMTVKPKPQTSLLVFSSFDELVEYLREELGA